MSTTTTYRAPEKHAYLDAQIVDRHHACILDNLLRLLHIKPGDRVMEIGAGSGRQTKLLLDRGLRVTALEPDPYLAGKLQERLSSVESRPENRLEILQGAAGDALPFPDDLRLVCGFHVLHHLDTDTLKNLKKAFDLLKKRPGFAGWFFLEPHPRNLLYPLQILITPGMRFAEEKGIWRKDWEALLGDPGKPPYLGDVGLFPPRPVLALLPSRLQSLGTSPATRPLIPRIYRVYGQRYA